MIRGLSLLLIFAFLTGTIGLTKKNNHQILSGPVKLLGHNNEHIDKPTNSTKQWALLVAGSNGYYNYRHQADVCHAYQVLRRHGIPAENIITMMYDDIANHSMNPTPGVIINHPGGENVYDGVVIDYARSDVTPDNFLKVLSGNSAAMSGIGSGKVIKSGPEDHVFVNFVDHGAPGLLAFPSGELHARELQDTLLDMYHKKKFGKLVMYVEACESGSMFEDLLPDDLNIFVTTAANAHEHSFACYYDNKYETYLGDVYSVMWMEDSDVEDLAKETLFKQFSIIRKNTTTSHVQEYGDLSINHMSVAEFQGYDRPAENQLPSRKFSPLDDAVPSGDVPLEILRRKLGYSNSDESSKDISRKIRHIEKKRQHLKDVMKQIVSKSAGHDPSKTKSILENRAKLTNFSCYEKLVRQFSKTCFHLPKNEYAYRQLYILANLCQSDIDPATISQALDTACVKKHIGII